jgi:hypothetical protein
VLPQIIAVIELKQEGNTFFIAQNNELKTVVPIVLKIETPLKAPKCLL